MGKFICLPLLLFSLLFSPAELLGTQPARQPIDVPTRMIEDDSTLRISLVDSWFREAPATVLARRPQYHTLRGGTRIQVRTERSAQNRDEFAIILAREQNGAFPGWAQGSWVLTRRMDNDPAGSRIRVFLRSDFNTFVQFRPFRDGQSLMDVVVYDAFLVRSLPLPVSFERLFVLPVETVLNMAGSRFPRRYFDPDPGMYRDSRAFVSAVRSRLSELSFVNDGALDEHGNFVFIATQEPQTGPGRRGVNCSGFAKWIVDGILRPITGERLPIIPLKQAFGDRGTILTETWEELRDPFFGLDWTRNLASQAWSVKRSPQLGSIVEEFEVRDWPFSHIINRLPCGVSRVQVFPGYTLHAGFCFTGLHALMYTLAIDEPGHIYLAAVNTDIGAPITRANPRGLPRIRQFYHIAVLVPFFTEQGVFQVVVFESAAETSFARFRTRYPGQLVNLVRIPIEGAFDP